MPPSIKDPVLIYYHASKYTYDIGGAIGPIPPNETNHFVASYQPSDVKARAEEVLEEFRPEDDIRRSRSIYLFSAIEQCVHYGDAQYRSHDYNIYKVEATPRKGKPMALVERVRELIEEGDEGKAERMAREYWIPSREWRYLEFLCESCTVKELQARADIMYDYVRIPKVSFDHAADLQDARIDDEE